jgi:dTDP-glucose 4,6-dehydratase
VQSLIEACKTHPSTSLFHISTDEVYGDIGDDDPPRTVEHPLYPSSPYAASKAAAEMLVMAAKRTFGIRTAVTRCTNNYGPHQADEKFLPTIVRNVLKDEPIPIYGTGKNKRDWLYVTDHCDALEIILANSQAFEDGAFFNISADAERENIEVAKAVLDIMGKPQDMLSFVEDRLGHDWRYALDSSGTHALGWKPSTSFDDGLKKTVEWYTRKYSS